MVAIDDAPRASAWMDGWMGLGWDWRGTGRGTARRASERASERTNDGGEERCTSTPGS